MVAISNNITNSEKKSSKHTWEKDVHNVGPVGHDGDAGGLQLHGQVCQVCLQFCKGLFALATHIVLQDIHLDLDTFVFSFNLR